MGKLGCDAHGDLNVTEFSKPLPSIGIYVASASFLCALSMAADLLHGFRHRKFWFPCNFFSLNATSLTLIAVGIKLSLDLNTSMPSRQDQLSKLSSSVFACIVMANSMPSLGIMETKDLLANVVALGILIITLVVNICIQLGTGAIYVFWKEHLFTLFLMLLMLLILCFSALTVPTTKNLLELKYKKKYEIAVKECPVETETTRVMKLKQDLMKFWMMAHTCSPQFVMARSVTCTASGFLCLLSALTLGEAMVQSYLRPGSLGFCNGDSDYKWSTTLALVSQTTAVAIGSIAPATRWFTAVNFRCPIRGNKYYGEEFRVESYWTQCMAEGKERPLRAWIFGGRRWRKSVHDAKRRVLDGCIVIQYGLVLASKVIRFASVYCVSRILICFYFSIRRRSSDEKESGSTKLDLARFVLHLEGESELVELMVRSNCEATDHWIQNGRKNQPRHLIEFLEASRSGGFEGILDFDSYEVPSLASEEPPNCWALPLVTLTSIAVALPNIKACALKKLLKAVDEALVYVNKFEHVLDMRGDLANARKAAEVVWLGVDLYQKWLDVDLRKLSSKQERTSEETLEELVDIAKKKFSESWQANLMVCIKQKASHWPMKILAANSMYRICQTMLENNRRGEDLFKEMERMISDIVSGCLANTPLVISMKCLVTAVEVREESVGKAALHLGRTEKILEIIEKRRIPELSPDQMGKIDEWRTFFRFHLSV